jgi:acetolactate synthase-1/2/3 large subunit
MTGAKSLVQTLLNQGVEVCFANPGTSEMHFVAAVDQIKGMHTVLGLFEGVCTGAADGYARMTGKPAATLLHLGPGLANGLANLHNARRAFSPIVNIVGDHATYHLKYDAPLTTDIEAIAGTVSGWVRKCKDAASVPEDAAEAVSASMEPPGQVATLILPADCSWNESVKPALIRPKSKAAKVASHTIDQIANVLRSGDPTAILMGDPFMMAEELWLAGCISRATGARIMGSRVNSRIQRGAGRVRLDRLPYLVKPALKMLEGTAQLILVGAKPPVSFFAWKNLPNDLVPAGCRVHTLAAPNQDGLSALHELANVLNAPSEPEAVGELKRPDLPSGEMTPEKAWTILAALMPQDSIISDEGVTSSRDADNWMSGAPSHEWLCVTGGSIGQGMPVATGAAVACPERKVFAMQADGSGMYTLQALWTQAREALDVVTVIFANRSYKILEGELKRMEVQQVSSNIKKLLKLTPPDIDWVKLANGMGVNAARAKTTAQYVRHLETAIHTPGPHLIEVVF